MFVKTSKIIGIVICILIPLIITSFIAYYSYKDPDEIMGNQNKWREYYKENEFGTTMKEKLESYTRLKSYLYDSTPVVDYTDTNNNYKLIGFRYLSSAEATSVSYTFYLYAIDFNQLDIPETSNLSVPYAFDQVDLREIPEEERTSASVTRFYEIPDTEAKAKTGENEDEAVYAYTFSFNSTAGISDLKTLTFKIESVHGEERTLIFDNPDDFVGKGFQLTGILRSAKELKNLQTQQGSTITSGLSGDESKVGKGYTAFIFPTVLWISAIALVVSGGMSYLFYIIWTAEETDSKKVLPKKAKSK
jgi:hypothetical protein